MERYPSVNVLGGPLEPCSTSPVTGYFRDGCCETGPQDFGLHVVCAVMTVEFLAFSKTHGNDLSTARPEFGFPGLWPGERWCVCASRWKEALEADVAPPVVLAATHVNALDVIAREDLERHAVDAPADAGPGPDGGGS